MGEAVFQASPIPLLAFQLLQWHRLHAQHTGYGGNDGAHNFQDIFPGFFAYFHNSMFLRMIVLKFFTYLEARTLLHPLPRLHRPISVQIGTEVAVAAYTGIPELL